MIALSRAAGIPARYLEGVLYLEPATEALARREHAWLEVYLPDIGWTTMDPTMGRSLGMRDKYFAANSPDHIIVTRGRNPSALRGASYFTHIYWPGPSAEIKIEEFGWQITPAASSLLHPPAQVAVHDHRDEDNQTVDQLGPEAG
jgi:transglutaminase-like putative cysteine protease